MVPSKEVENNIDLIHACTFVLSAYGSEDHSPEYSNIQRVCIHHQVSNSLWVEASDRSKSINLEMLEDMFHVEEKEKNSNSGEHNLHLSLVCAIPICHA